MSEYHSAFTGWRLTWLLLFLIANADLSAGEITSRAASDNTREVIPLETRRELFVDHHLIARLDGVTLRLHHPQPAGVAVRYDGPTDSPFSFYTTVLKDDHVYRMYYRGHEPGPSENGERRPRTLTCYAESPDGIHWTKPALGIVEINASRENNAILPHGNAFVAFLDHRPGVPPSERYKGCMEADNEDAAPTPEVVGSRGLVGYISGDGIHWRTVSDRPIVRPNPALFNQFDGQNVMFWSEVEASYVLFSRHAVGGEIANNGPGIRSIARSTSPDFLHWQALQPMSYSDTGTTRPSQHLYVNQTQPYFRAPHIYVALPGRFQAGRRALTTEQSGMVFPDPAAGGVNDISDGVLLTARAGSTRFDFTFRESFVRPGIGYRNWTSRSNYPALGIVPTGTHEMSIYVQREYAHTSAYLERMTLRLDGFASANAPYAGGELLTKPLTFTGTALEINYSTSAAGGIRVELQHPDGRPIDGFALGDCREIIGDEISRVVMWKDGGNLSDLIGQPLRVRFVMKDADLFSLRFRP